MWFVDDLIIVICCYDVNVFLFFFKQKTAYEMRISDWSSDVCSSDLYARSPPARFRAAGGCDGPPAPGRSPVPVPHSASRPTGHASARPPRSSSGPVRGSSRPALPGRSAASSSADGRGGCDGRPRDRSEEHTSELQSLMRISYAVFCLKKKLNQNQYRNIVH